MKRLMVLALTLASLNAFASNEFQVLKCAVDHQYPTPAEKAFSMNIKFQKKIDAINDSGLDQIVKADLEIKSGNYSAVAKNVGFTQATEGYGYELKFQGMILNSLFGSYISLQPSFKGFISKKLTDFRGMVEINAKAQGNDAMVVKTQDLKCTVVQ